MQTLLAVIFSVSLAALVDMLSHSELWIAFFKSINNHEFLIAAALAAISFVTARRLYNDYPRERLTTDQLFMVSFVGLILLFLFAGSRVYNPESMTALVTLGVGCLGTAGWLFTNYVNMRNHKKSHTMSILMQLRSNAIAHEHKINLYRFFPPGTKIEVGDIEKIMRDREDKSQYDITSSNKCTSASDSIAYQANLYEFICAGMRKGDLDEAMIKNSLRGIMVNYYDHILPYISFVRSKNPLSYEHYTHYVTKWRIREYDQVRAHGRTK